MPIALDKAVQPIRVPRGAEVHEGLAPSTDRLDLTCTASVLAPVLRRVNECTTTDARPMDRAEWSHKGVGHAEWSHLGWAALSGHTWGFGVGVSPPFATNR